MRLSLVFTDKAEPKKINFQTHDELDPKKQRKLARKLLKERLPESVGREFDLTVRY